MPQPGPTAAPVSLPFSRWLWLSPASSCLLGLAGRAAASTGLVINEVYGAGGNAGALYNADFVELYNPTGTAIALAGCRCSTDPRRARWWRTGGAARASIPAGGVLPHPDELRPGSERRALPTPDLIASTGVTMAAAGGQVYPRRTRRRSTRQRQHGGRRRNVIDMVGFGRHQLRGRRGSDAAATTTQSIARSATGPTPTATAADFRRRRPRRPQAGHLAAVVDRPGTKSGRRRHARSRASTSPRPAAPRRTRGAPPSCRPASPSASNGTRLRHPDTAGHLRRRGTVTDSAAPDPATAPDLHASRCAPSQRDQHRSPRSRAPATSRPLDRPDRDHPGCRHRGVPDRWLNGFYIQTPGADTRRRRRTRSSSSAATAASPPTRDR